MRVITFNIDLRLNPNDIHPVTTKAFYPYPEDNPEIVEMVLAESADGKYEIENWPEPTNTATLNDRVETLETDTADLTDALDMLLSGVTE